MKTLYFSPSANEIKLNMDQNGVAKIDYEAFINGTNGYVTSSAITDGLWLFTDEEWARDWAIEGDSRVFKIEVDDEKYSTVDFGPLTTRDNIKAMLSECATDKTHKASHDLIMLSEPNGLLADIIFEAVMSCAGSDITPLDDDTRNKYIEKETETILEIEKMLESGKFSEYAKEADKKIKWAVDIVRYNIRYNFEDASDAELAEAYKSIDWTPASCVITNRELIESLEFSDKNLV